MNTPAPITVIIPVYNAEAFLESSVRSAVDQVEVGEVLLIEDGSTDRSLATCRQLAEREPKVRLLQHLNGANRGAGASRNLGLMEAKYELIAFLDADDYFLPNRFAVSYPILRDRPEVDGVWEAVGTELIATATVDRQFKQLTTIKYAVAPKDLFSIIIRPGDPGHFCTDGIVFRRSLLDRTGLFNAELRLHQDTDLWIRMAYFGTLVPGKFDEAVAVRRVHDNNRITHSNFKSKQLFRIKLYEFFRDKPLRSKDYRYLARLYLSYHPTRKRSKRKLLDLFYWGTTAIKEQVGGDMPFIPLFSSRKQ